MNAVQASLPLNAFLIADPPIKLRLDQLLVERGLADSRAKAQAYIMAGQIIGPANLKLKAGTLLDPNTPLELKHGSRWVGRGGEKLEGALVSFGMTAKLTGAWLDCGASTGGFTDVLLANGVQKVYAIDVGYGQIDSRLREDSRVVVIEKFNIRNLTTNEVPGLLDGATLDLSFISSRIVLPVLVPFLKPGADVLLLFKPQFEGERKDIGKGGVIRDEDKRTAIRASFLEWAATQGWKIEDSAESAIKGQKGNVEYFFRMRIHP